MLGSTGSDLFYFVWDWQPSPVQSSIVAAAAVDVVVLLQSDESDYHWPYYGLLMRTVCITDQSSSHHIPPFYGSIPLCSFHYYNNIEKSWPTISALVHFIDTPQIVVGRCWLDKLLRLGRVERRAGGEEERGCKQWGMVPTRRYLLCSCAFEEY